MDIRSDRQKGLSYVGLGRKYHMDPRMAKRYAQSPRKIVLAVDHGQSLCMVTAIRRFCLCLAKSRQNRSFMPQVLERSTPCEKTGRREQLRSLQFRAICDLIKE